MDFAALIEEARADLSAFDAARYPDRFAAFEARAGACFEALAGRDAKTEAQALLDALEARRAALPRREQKQALTEQKRVLALFLSPAARRYGGEAEAFIRCLAEQWNARCPREPFTPGDYDAIMQGFEASFLGIPLRGFKRR